MRKFELYLFFCILDTVLLLNPPTANGAISDPVPGPSGDAFSIIPFGEGLVDRAPMRMQQVYDATAVANAGLAQGGWITGVWFVSDSQVGRSWSASLPKVEILMGTTTREVDGLSTVFAENFSISPIAVRPLGALLMGSGGPGQAIEIKFQTPFLYDPSAGNLMIDIKNFEPTGLPGQQFFNPGPLDAWNVAGDGVSRVYARDANASTGMADTIGLTSLFTFTPVPEPSILALLALAAAGGIWRWHGRSRT